eukprot:TRINITY_DN31051_c0_g3_i2.p1 TRINITY_DN31051_c0_g3~~TRINITY_DN31051_c0_g3_i2.p1  ORF type:complete len:678 (-),score=108.57 TRINITY_DN31051_c0_g3_i2:209-2122(-)
MLPYASETGRAFPGTSAPPRQIGFQHSSSCTSLPPEVPEELVSSDELKVRMSASVGHLGTRASPVSIVASGPPTTSGTAVGSVCPRGGPGMGGMVANAAEAYREATELMWNYELQRARMLLEPFRGTSAWHASAYAECAALRVVLTGRRCEALHGLELVGAAEALLSCALRGGTSIVQEVISAEMLLLRCGLQVVGGSRLRALLNLRQCWNAYHRLEHYLAKGGPPLMKDEGDFFSADDLRGRVNFGLGLFYLATSMLPVSMCPLARLAGFVIDRQQGKAHLSACTQVNASLRAPLAAIMLAIYHLDLEPDVRRAGELLVGCLSRRPDNVLLHWAGSLLAWRNTCLAEAINMLEQALSCCDPELGNQAVYLRYELGMLHFMCMEWAPGYGLLRSVYDNARSDKIFLPYKMLVTMQLAACAFMLGRNDEGENLARECSAPADWSDKFRPDGPLRSEADFARVIQVFVKRRVANRRLMAFEVMYFLRQLPRVPAPKLLELRATIREVARPYAEQCRHLLQEPPQREWKPVEINILVEHVSALMLECVILFYLGDADEAMTAASQVAQLDVEVPCGCSYLMAHGLYWAGRIHAVRGLTADARRCLRQAKSYKKYPFNISQKVSKVLDGLDREEDNGLARA